MALESIQSVPHGAVGKPRIRLDRFDRGPEREPLVHRVGEQQKDELLGGRDTPDGASPVDGGDAHGATARKREERQP